MTKFTVSMLTAAVVGLSAPLMAQQQPTSPASGNAQALTTHRIPAALAMEAANEVVSSCAAQGYRETAVVLDADGVVIAVLRGDGTGAHTLDSAHDKAFTAGSFKNDTIALAE